MEEDKMVKKNDISSNNLNVFYLLRVAQDIKVKDLAETLSVTPAYIHAIEKGERVPSERLLKYYAEALGVTPEIIESFCPNDHKDKKFKEVLLWILKKICD